MKPITLFFGDGEHPFALTAPMTRELQRKLGCGVGAILARFRTETFGFDDIREVIRCGLIGGGMDARDAEHLVATYVDGRPLAPVGGIAFDVLMDRFFGADDEPVPAPEPLAPIHERVADAFAAHEAGNV